MGRTKQVGMGVVMLGILGVMVFGDVTVTPLGGSSSGVGMPTMGEIQAEFDAARYTRCLQMISKTMGTTPIPPKEDRYVLLSLKGECLLAQKQGVAAADAFGAAGQVEGIDKKETALAVTTSEIIKRSVNLAYAPLTGKDKKPLSIAEKEKRGVAMAAYFADELARVSPDELAAMKSDDIEPTMDFMPKFRHLMGLELGATGETAETSPMQRALSEHARELVASSIRKMNTDADTMVALANSPTTEGTGIRHRRGLTDMDKAKLTDMLSACERVISRCKEMETGLGLDGEFFKVELADNDALEKRIKNMVSNGIFRTAKAAAAAAARPGGN